MLVYSIVSVRCTVRDPALRLNNVSQTYPSLSSCPLRQLQRSQIRAPDYRTHFKMSYVTKLGKFTLHVI